MKKVIIICIASFVFVSLSSQSTFSKSIDLDNGDESGMAIRVVEDGYLLLSGDGCFQFGYSFLKTDFDGNILWKKQLPAYPLYSTPDCYGNHGIAFKKGNNAIYYSGNLEPQGSTSDVFLMKTDENGDSIWLRTYVNPHTDKNATVLYRTDSTLLLFGDHALGSTNDDVIRLIETDLEGNVIWGGQYGNEFRMVGRQDIAQLDNGDIVFTYLASEKGNFDTIFLKITRINNQGLEVWTKDVNNLEYLWNPGSVVALDNGGFLLSSHRSNVDPGWWFPPILIWLDSLGNVVKQYNFPGETESIIVDLIITSAGIIIGTGYIDKWDLGFAGWVFALSQEGELLWNREIVDLRFPLKVSVLNAVEEAENGGLILTGFIWDTVSNQIPDVSNVNIWLVKLDSLGCLEPGCSDLQIVVSERNLPDRNDQFLIYPNPAQNELYIDKIADAERKDLQLIIRNFCGETELIIDLNNHNSEVISVSTLPNGIHYIQIIDQFGIIIQVEKFIIIK